MELICDTLRMERLVGRVNAQALVEGEVAPPASSPPMASVLSVDGQVVMGSAEALDGRLMMDGSVTLFVLYVATDGGLCGFESSSAFKHTMEMPPAEPGMSVSAQATLPELRFSLLDERRISVSANVDITCKVTMMDEVMALKDVDGIGDLQTKTRTLLLPENRHLGGMSMQLREDMRLPQGLPPIREVFHSRAIARVKNTMMEENRVVVEGELKVVTLYLSDDDSPSLQQVAHTLPFSQMMSADTLGDNLSAYVTGVDLYTANTQSEDHALLNIEATLRVELHNLSMAPVTVMEDAYSPSMPIEVETQSVSLMSPAASANARNTLRESLGIPEGAPPVIHAVLGSARAAVTCLTPRIGQLSIDGVIFASVIYACREERLHSFSQEFPFHCDIDMPGLDDDMDAEAEAAVESVYVSGSGDALDLKISLDCSARGYHFSSHPVVVGIRESNTAAPIDGLIIYFATPGEKIWDIAKKFRTTLSDMTRLNPDLGETVGPGGRKLLLYMRH